MLNIIYIFLFLYLFIDVSNVGFGCVYRIKWFFGVFVFEWFEYYIFVFEFLLIVFVLEIWGFSFKNCMVILYLDNMVVV